MYQLDQSCFFSTPLKTVQFDFAITKNIKSFLTMEGPGGFFVLHVLVPCV